MTVKGYLMQSFETGPSLSTNEVTVPVDSKLLGAKVLNDGIYLWYEIPEDNPDLPTRMDKFIIAANGKPLPEGAEFVSLIDTIIETPKGQGVVVFPIFKLKL